MSSSVGVLNSCRPFRETVREMVHAAFTKAEHHEPERIFAGNNDLGREEWHTRVEMKIRVQLQRQLNTEYRRMQSKYARPAVFGQEQDPSVGW